MMRRSLLDDLTLMLESNHNSIARLQSLEAQTKSLKSKHKKEVLKAIDDMFSHAQQTLGQCTSDLLRINKFIQHALQLYHQGDNNMEQVLAIAQNISLQADSHSIEERLADLRIPRFVRLVCEDQPFNQHGQEQKYDFSSMAGAIENFAQSLNIAFDFGAPNHFQLLTRIKQKVIQDKQEARQILQRLTLQYNDLLSRSFQYQKLVDNKDQIQADYEYLAEEYRKLKALQQITTTEASFVHDAAHNEMVSQYEQEIQKLNEHKLLQESIVKQLTEDNQLLKNQNFEMKMQLLTLKTEYQKQSKRSHEPQHFLSSSHTSTVASPKRESINHNRILQQYKQRPFMEVMSPVREGPESTNHIRQQIEYKKQEFSNKVRMLLTKYT